MITDGPRTFRVPVRLLGASIQGGQWWNPSRYPPRTMPRKKLLTRAGHHRRHCRVETLIVPPADQLDEIGEWQGTLSELHNLYEEVVVARLLSVTAKMPDPLIVLVTKSNPFDGTDVIINTGEFVPLGDRIKMRVARRDKAEI